MELQTGSHGLQKSSVEPKAGYKGPEQHNKSSLGPKAGSGGSERQTRAIRGFEGRESAPQEPEATQEGMGLSCSEITKCSDSPYIGLSHFNP